MTTKSSPNDAKMKTGEVTDQVDNTRQEKRNTDETRCSRNKTNDSEPEDMNASNNSKPSHIMSNNSEKKESESELSQSANKQETKGIKEKNIEDSPTTLKESDPEKEPPANDAEMKMDEVADRVDSMTQEIRATEETCGSRNKTNDCEPEEMNDSNDSDLSHTISSNTEKKESENELSQSENKEEAKEIKQKCIEDSPTTLKESDPKKESPSNDAEMKTDEVAKRVDSMRQEIRVTEETCCSRNKTNDFEPEEMNDSNDSDLSHTISSNSGKKESENELIPSENKEVKGIKEKEIEDSLTTLKESDPEKKSPPNDAEMKMDKVAERVDSMRQEIRVTEETCCSRNKTNDCKREEMNDPNDCDPLHTLSSNSEKKESEKELSQSENKGEVKEIKEKSIEDSPTTLKESDPKKESPSNDAEMKTDEVVNRVDSTRQENRATEETYCSRNKTKNSKPGEMNDSNNCDPPHTMSSNSEKKESEKELSQSENKAEAKKRKEENKEVDSNNGSRKRVKCMTAKKTDETEAVKEQDSSRRKKNKEEKEATPTNSSRKRLRFVTPKDELTCTRNNCVMKKVKFTDPKTVNLEERRSGKGRQQEEEKKLDDSKNMTEMVKIKEEPKDDDEEEDGGAMEEETFTVKENIVKMEIEENESENMKEIKKEKKQKTTKSSGKRGAFIASKEYENVSGPSSRIEVIDPPGYTEIRRLTRRQAANLHLELRDEKGRITPAESKNPVRTIYALRKNDIIIGRDEDCDIIFKDIKGMGEKHLKITFTARGRAYVHPLYTSGLTYLNGEMIRGRKPLYDNDVITAVKISYTFTYPDSSKYSIKGQVAASKKIRANLRKNIKKEPKIKVEEELPESNAFQQTTVKEEFDRNHIRQRSNAESGSSVMTLWEMFDEPVSDLSSDEEDFLLLDPAVFLNQPLVPGQGPAAAALDRFLSEEIFNTMRERNNIRLGIPHNEKLIIFKKNSLRALEAAAARQAAAAELWKFGERDDPLERLVVFYDNGDEILPRNDSDEAFPLDVYLALLRSLKTQHANKQSLTQMCVLVRCLQALYDSLENNIKLFPPSSSQLTTEDKCIIREHRQSQATVFGMMTKFQRRIEILERQKIIELDSTQILRTIQQHRARSWLPRQIIGR